VQRPILAQCGGSFKDVVRFNSNTTIRFPPTPPTGFSWATARRAKRQLGVETVRKSEGGDGFGRIRFREVLRPKVRKWRKLRRRKRKRKLINRHPPGHDHRQAAGRCRGGARRDFVGAVAGTRLMRAAYRHRELIAHFATERTGLRETHSLRLSKILTLTARMGNLDRNSS